MCSTGRYATWCDSVVLQAPEVLHAQTLGGNMLSRDTPPPLGKMGGLRVGKIYKKNLCV